MHVQIHESFLGVLLQKVMQTGAPRFRKMNESDLLIIKAIVGIMETRFSAIGRGMVIGEQTSQKSFHARVFTK